MFGIAKAVRDVQIMMRRTTMEYQQPDTTMTLRQGLAEYYRDSGVYVAAQLNEKSASWFRVHDAVHVVFGCNITPEQEALNSTWTMFGTDWHWSESVVEGMRTDQRERFMKEIFGGVGYGRMTFLVFATLPGVVEVARRARGMPRKWPKERFEQYLDTPLDQLRREYRIAVYP